MWWVFWIAVALAIAALIEIPRLRAVRPFYERGCAGMRWRRQFPDASPQEIRDFLQLFVDAFGFRRGSYLKFRPDDKLMDLYRAMNPPNWSIGDNCEIEMLIDEIHDNYHFNLEPLMREDLTLANVFACVHSVE